MSKRFIVVGVVALLMGAVSPVASASDKDLSGSSETAKIEKAVSISSLCPVLNAAIGKDTIARFVVRVPRNPDNRWLTISWDSEDPGSEAGSTTQELRGENSPAIFDFDRLRFGHGRYLVTAEVIRFDGSIKYDTITVIVN